MTQHRRLRLALFAAAACLACGGAFGQRDPAAGARLVQRLAAGVPQTVVVYGTSLTAGNLWPVQMRDWLTNTYAGPLTVINSGLSGKNSKDGLENLAAKVLAYRPDTVFIEFGINDAFTNYADAAYNISVDQAKSNLLAMIDRILTNRADTEIILQTMNQTWNNPPDTGVSARYRPQLAACYQNYRDVAAARGLLLVDHEPNWRALESNAPATYQGYVTDGTHPTAAGHAAITMPLLKKKLVGGIRWFDASGRPGPVRVDADVCVYGGTAAGVAAAVEAARLGRSCVFLTPDRHPGGLSANGLGWTDTGDTKAIGGLAREFYHRIYQHYQDTNAWSEETRAAYVARSGKDPDDTKQLMYTFEPAAAAAVFEDLLAESGVTAVCGRLRRGGGGVRKSGAELQEILTDDGQLVVRARQFIDAGYEGDLMAEAGVYCTVGREANATYGETLNGIQTARATGNQLIDGINPYRVAGNPASGLLPGVEASAGGADGQGDGRLQAYTYRLCLTDVATNRRAIAQPAGYDEADFELLFRSIEAGRSNSFFTSSPMPNRKTDSNNAGGLSTDFIGGNYSLTGGWNYAEAGYAKRDEVALAHRTYQQGLLWTLQNHARVPATVRSAWSAWGLPLDEFADNDGWPPGLYVREARRMVAPYVLAQAEVNQSAGHVPSDPVGMGSYNMDSHNVQRYVTTNGVVKNEGDVQTGPANGAYGISLRALAPASNEVSNLLVPVCLSASHIAFGSIRMEPVFMILGQSAAAAAAQALGDGVPVQALDYARLRLTLLAAGQVLSLSTNAPVGAEVILDNADASGVAYTGAWTASTASSGSFWGTNYVHDGSTNKGGSTASFAPTLPADGLYTVQMRWPSNANRATNVPVDVVHAAGTNTVRVNQTANNAIWVTLLTTNFAAGTAGRVVIRTTGTTGYVIADAVRFYSGLPAVSALAADPEAREDGEADGRFLVVRDGDPTSALPVRYTVGGTAASNADYRALSGMVTIPAGAASVAIPVHPFADAAAEGDETVVLALAADPAYVVGAPASATVVLRDLPRDEWRHAHFSAAELSDPAVSGDAADPDRDGRPNLLERALGGDPRASDAAALDPLGSLVDDAGGRRFRLEYAKAADAPACQVEWASTLAAGDWTTNGVSDEFYLPGSGRFAREVTPAPGTPAVFLRLSVRP